MNNNNNRILIVDDEPDLTKICMLALEHYGYIVDASNDPQEVLSKYKPGTYDLVILDIKMPKMDGFELYQEIKKKDNNAKICFLTASELHYEKLRKKEFSTLEGNTFIRKLVSNKELLAQVNKMINRQDTHLEVIFLSHNR
jgi:two-component system catabolic regulation response regulator CreB/two-component system response regulator ChvI